MIFEKNIIERIGCTRLDKIELSDGEIIEIKNVDDLMERELLVNNTTLNKYCTHTGQQFSYLHIKKDGELHNLKAGCTGYGKKYVVLQSGVTDENCGNLIGNSVEEYKDQIKRIESKLENDYGIISTFKESKVKYIEIHRTFVTEFEFADYKRVIELILAEMPRMNTLSTFGTTKNDHRYFTEKARNIGTYSVWSRKKATGNSKQYKQITFYDKKNQMQGLIKFTGNYMRFEIRLKGIENIKNAFGTNLFYELTQENVNDYFKSQIEKMIVNPLEKWKDNRDKFLLKLMKQQYKDNLNNWQINTLRVLLNKEVEQEKPCLLDVEELYPLIDKLKVSKKERIKRNMTKQAVRYERVFCNKDTFKLAEIIDKLLI